MKTSSEQRYIQYNNSNLEWARQNRKNPTPAEEKVWEELLRDKKTWYKFTRQKMIDSFIVDFYCSKLLLAIEIDWDSHNNKEVYDCTRTDKINNMWIIVIRYSNEEILENIKRVKSDILEKLRLRKEFLELEENEKFISE